MSCEANFHSFFLFFFFFFSTLFSAERDQDSGRKHELLWHFSCPKLFRLVLIRNMGIREYPVASEASPIWQLKGSREGKLTNYTASWLGQNSADGEKVERRGKRRGDKPDQNLEIKLAHYEIVPHTMRGTVCILRDEKTEMSTSFNFFDHFVTPKAVEPSFSMPWLAFVPVPPKAVWRAPKKTFPSLTPPFLFLPR